MISKIGDEELNPVVWKQRVRGVRARVVFNHRDLHAVGTQGVNHAVKLSQRAIKHVVVFGFLLVVVVASGLLVFAEMCRTNHQDVLGALLGCSAHGVKFDGGEGSRNGAILPFWRFPAWGWLRRGSPTLGAGH